MLNDQVIADNLRIIERNRELECELARLKARLGRVSRIADRLHDEARALSELSGEHPMRAGVASAMAVKFGIAGELREVLR